MSLIPQSLSFLLGVTQNNYLLREFNDALFPALLYRMSARAEEWTANIGETITVTRSSLLAPNTTPVTPGSDPNAKNLAFEQWVVSAAQYADALDVHMPTHRTAIDDVFGRSSKQLGLQAGQSLNRLARDTLFASYLSGETMTTAAVNNDTAVPVANLSGFTTSVVDGQVQQQAVSNNNPLTIVVGGFTRSVTAATPTDATDPLGPGTLTISAAVTVGAGAKVRASTAPTILRPGGLASIDEITETSALDLASIRTAVSILRRRNVPPCDDGTYHVHLDPLAVSQVFADNEFQRLHQGAPDDPRYNELAVSRIFKSTFLENNESPNYANVGDTAVSRTNGLNSKALHAEVVNGNGVRVLRTIVMGGGALMERYIPETADYVSEAGVTGKVGAFSVISNNSMAVTVDRTRFVIRAPMDRLQQVVSLAWSFSGGWGVPTDFRTGDASIFKRGVVIESSAASA